MKITVIKEIEVPVKTLHVEAGVRYWEDSKINDESDTEIGDNIPCKKGDIWAPIIELEAGKIINWEQGKKASIHYKVCDRGSYFLKDQQGNIVASIEQNYVPSILCPKSQGYGDYIIMDIDENGFIQNWKVDLSGFENDE
jgi:hypothetical protein